MRWNDQNRTIRMSDDAFGDATNQHVFESRTPVRGRDDKIDIFAPSEVANLFHRCP
jgi:hypothetical protein